jgi:hypothetical protein
MIQIDKLRKVENHLRNGILAHKVFDFSTIDKGEIGENGCGTNGCAIGELPVIFPDDFVYDTDGDVIVTNPKEGVYQSSVWEEIDNFFGITSNMSNHLFVPEAQDRYKYGGNELDKEATKEEVADNIAAFIEVVERQKWNS